MNFGCFDCANGTIVALAICVVGFSSPALADDDVRSARDVVARSVPFIEKEGAAWIASRDCLTCHHTSFMVWSLHAANRQGIDVDREKLKQTTDWATDWKNMVSPNTRAQADRDTWLLKSGDTMAQLLIGRPQAEAETATVPEWVTEYSRYLVKGQKEDGSWSPGGQLPGQKRPKRETEEVSTAWALLAFAKNPVSADSAMARDKARAWLGTETSGKSTEWWATRLMLERQLGNADKANQLRADLLKLQRDDGGWGWLTADDSDALGTGIALYALGQDNVGATDPAVEKAKRFLATTQRDDGSWAVRGTKEGKKSQIEPTSVFWGTCWAVIGLCETMEPHAAPATATP